MASSKSLLDSVKERRSIYDLEASSPISDERILEILEHVITYAPSPFNMQTARVVVLFKEDHKKFWAAAKEVVAAQWGADAAKMLGPKIDEYQAAYGTMLFLEDQATIREWAGKDGMKPIAHLFPQWSEHSSGMAQYAMWCALEAEGLGCNLQHFELMQMRAAETWNLSKDWSLKSQLVFGKPLKGPRRDKFETMLPLSDRIFVHGK